MAGMALENVRSKAAHQVGMFDVSTDGPDTDAPPHPLDSQENLRVHAKLLDYWYTCLDAFVDNRAEQMLDYDFYDHIQWSEQDRVALAVRHQAPLTYNKIKMALDWIIGTERRTRIDGVVHPRAEDDVDLAQIKSELLKYLSDANRVPWARSAAFKDAAIAGLGWTEETIRTDRQDEPVACTHIPWKQMRRDPFSRAADLSDARFVTREKFVDLDYAEAMFPERLDMVSRAARDHYDGDEGYAGEEENLPQVFRRYDGRGHELQGKRITGRTSLESRCRMRVRLIEIWFRKPVATKKLWGGRYTGEALDHGSEEHQSALADMKNASATGGNTIYSITDAVKEEMWSAILTEEGLLQLQPSPFKHGKFPYTPYWCYRRDRDGMEYGVVRGIRDSQEDLNKRMSKLLWSLSTNQLFHEDGAIDPDRLEEVKREIAKPNGVIPLLQGGLAKIKVERNLDIAEAQIKMLELDAAHIHDGSGVNREQLGRDTNAVSGRAILAKQQEGSVTTAELFDNYRLGIQLSGEKQLSLMEQFMTTERQFRIVGDRKGIDWRNINQYKLVGGTDPATGEPILVWEMENDITRSQADFVVDQQDFRETMRQAAAEQFFELLGKMPPDISLQLMDLAFEMVDMPGKDEIVKRIRSINGQANDDEDPASPEALQRAAQAEQEQQIANRERMAALGISEGKAKELEAKVAGMKLKNKSESLSLAEILNLLLPLAPAADRLVADAEGKPVPALGQTVLGDPNPPAPAPAAQPVPTEEAVHA